MAGSLRGGGVLAQQAHRRRIERASADPQCVYGPAWDGHVGARSLGDPSGSCELYWQNPTSLCLPAVFSCRSFSSDVWTRRRTEFQFRPGRVYFRSCANRNWLASMYVLAERCRSRRGEANTRCPHRMLAPYSARNATSGTTTYGSVALALGRPSLALLGAPTRREAHSRWRSPPMRASVLRRRWRTPA